MRASPDDRLPAGPDDAPDDAVDPADPADPGVPGVHGVPGDRVRDLLRPRERAVLAAGCVAVFALYATYAWVRHLRFLTTGFDLGIFDQVTRDYARFQAPIVPLKAPGYNLLGDHFHPIIALWAPLYWIWADPRMLLLAQAALIAVSIVPVVRFTARRWGARPALVVGLVYGLSWPLQRMVQFDVHEIAFAVPLIAVAVDALDRRAYRVLAVACALLLLVREDMGAFVLVVGLLVAVRSRRRRRDLLLGAGFVVAGAVAFRTVTSVVIPHFAGGLGFAYWTFPALGPDLASAVRFAVTHPFEVLRLMVTPWEKAHTLLMLGMPTLYLCVASPYVLLTLPFLAQRMLNSRELLWSTNFHYSSVLAPILVASGVDCAHRLFGLAERGWAARRARREAIGARVRGPRRLRLVEGWIAGCVAVVAVGMYVQAGDYPVSRIWTGRFWAADSRVQAFRETLPLIPDGVCIEAENTFAPQLTGRTYVTRINRSDGLATWMVLDFSREDTGWEGPTPAAAYDQALARGFVVVAQKGVVVLLNRPGAAVDPVCRTP